MTSREMQYRKISILKICMLKNFRFLQLIEVCNSMKCYVFYELIFKFYMEVKFIGLNNKILLSHIEIMIIKVNVSNYEFHVIVSRIVICYRLNVTR